VQRTLADVYGRDVVVQISEAEARLTSLTSQLAATRAESAAQEEARSQVSTDTAATAHALQAAATQLQVREPSSSWCSADH
jgi:hypothetical protein